jgi:hypothetical protein
MKPLGKTMKRFHQILSAGLLFVTCWVQAAEPTYSRDVSKWQEVTIPPVSQAVAHELWSSAANHSKHEWQVFSKDGLPQADLRNYGEKKKSDQPGFTPRVERFGDASAFAKVDDGWLVGFDKGEWGGALYWYSQDGKNTYQISDNQIVDFVTLPDGIYAIEGLAHLGSESGSIIRITRSGPDARWQAAPFVKLPFAPYALSMNRDGAMLITLSNSLVSVGRDRKVHTLLAGAPWWNLYPASSVLSKNGQKLYIGMRQYVGEFDLATKKLRMLVPARAFVSVLPKDREQQIRRSRGG